MIDAKQIPYMLELLDDDSEHVRGTVISKLASFGPLLKKELEPYPLNSLQRQIVGRILSHLKENQIKVKWPHWINVSSQYSKLEQAVCVLSEYIDDSVSAAEIKNELDSLAFEYRRSFPFADPILLSRYLFKDKGYVGDEDDYYNPQNCNLGYVLKQKKGIPISLVSLYMLVGSRLGLNIEGCNFPGHFLARIYMDGQPLFIDCFHSGDVIQRDDIYRVKETVIDGLDEILTENVEITIMIRRYLANLVRMYQESNDEHGQQVVIQLFKQLDFYMEYEGMSNISPGDITVEKLPVFDAGQIIKHQRYGYRGVIVDLDIQCMASEDWYYANHTQPNIYQPWYHVLVDDSEQITYVAESNLVLDYTPKEIVHPLLDYFFNGLVHGLYIRNGNPWPETEY